MRDDSEVLIWTYVVEIEGHKMVLEIEVFHGFATLELSTRKPNGRGWTALRHVDPDRIHLVLLEARMLARGHRVLRSYIQLHAA